MAQDIVSGLFGLSPNQVAQQQQQQIDLQAQNFAQLDPFQRAAQSMYQAGAGLGGIGAGMLGMVNPEVEAAKQREATLGQVDISTPEGLLQGAELARQRGDVRMQIQLQALAEQRKAELVDQEFKSAQAAAQRAKLNQTASASSAFGKLIEDRAIAHAAGDTNAVKAYDAMIRKETMIQDKVGGKEDKQAVMEGKKEDFSGKIISNMNELFNPNTGKLDVDLAKGVGMWVGSDLFPDRLLGQDVKDKLNVFESLKSQILQMNLAEAKERAGQSFGSMQVAEWDRFQGLWKNMDRTSSPELIAKNMGEIYRMINKHTPTQNNSHPDDIQAIINKYKGK